MQIFPLKCHDKQHSTRLSVPLLSALACSADFAHPSCSAGYYLAEGMEH